jgi:hypothetical protein
MNRVICAPCGGLMNHVRWLILLSPEFKWGISEKMHFISNIVYPERRSSFVWLSHEYLFRELPHIQKLVTVNHSIDACMTIGTPKKVLVLVPNPDLSYKHYLKFNPALNGLVKQATLDQTITLDDIKRSYRIAISNDNDRNKLQSAISNDILTLNIDKLYTNRELDIDIYSTIVDFFDISNQYESANLIHNKWFDLQKHNEKAMLTLGTDVEAVKSYWRISSNEAITQTEYDIALRLINETYGE